MPRDRGPRLTRPNILYVYARMPRYTAPIAAFGRRGWVLFYFRKDAMLRRFAPCSSQCRSNRRMRSRPFRLD